MSHTHLSGPKDMMSLIRDVRFLNFTQKGAIASEKQKGDSTGACVCVHEC